MFADGRNAYFLSILRSLSKWIYFYKNYQMAVEKKILELCIFLFHIHEKEKLCITNEIAILQFHL